MVPSAPWLLLHPSMQGPERCPSPSIRKRNAHHQLKDSPMTNKPSDQPPATESKQSTGHDALKAHDQSRDEAVVDSLDRRTRPKVQAAQKRLDDNSIRVVHLFQILLLLLSIQIAVWIWDAWRERQVTLTEPIGNLQGMTAGEGWRGSWVIEVRTALENGSVETRLYPLDEPMAATQGTPLILETRGNGELFICDAQRHACVRTASDMLR